MDEIFRRCSVRRYTDQEITGEDEEKILKAAFCAPSAANRQPWEFVVVRSHETMEKISEFSPYASPLKEAMMAVIVLADTSHDLKLEYDLMDCAAATENMLLEAESLGIGSVWLGFYPEEDRVEKLKAFLDLPEQIKPLWVVAFGYPARPGHVMDKYKEEKVHHETY